MQAFSLIIKNSHSPSPSQKIPYLCLVERHWQMDIPVLREFLTKATPFFWATLLPYAAGLKPRNKPFTLFYFKLTPNEINHSVIDYFNLLFCL
jgi:hypothetical protein